MKKYTWMFLGFMLGVFYVMGCGGGSAISRGIAIAVDLVYDNSQSGLRATTMQGAIDEVAMMAVDRTEALIGTWHGKFYYISDDGKGFEDTFYNLTLTFNSDGSYSCEMDSPSGNFRNDTTECDGAVNWAVIGDVINLKQEEASSILWVTSMSPNVLNMRYGSSYWMTLTRI